MIHMTPPCSHRRQAGSHRRPGKWGEEKYHIPKIAATAAELAATGAVPKLHGFNFLIDAMCAVIRRDYA